jgi:hypothetical protein
MSVLILNPPSTKKIAKAFQAYAAPGEYPQPLLDLGEDLPLVVPDEIKNRERLTYYWCVLKMREAEASLSRLLSEAVQQRPQCTSHLISPNMHHPRRLTGSSTAGTFGRS